MRRKKEPVTTAPQGKEPLRLITLSDGLFATVLTLLVLDLRIPTTPDVAAPSIHAFLKAIGPHLFSYLLTFLVGGSYWLAHHRDFELIAGSDRRLLSYNLLFLLFVGLLPFSTALISSAGISDRLYAFYWAAYSADIILAGVMLTLTWAYACSRGFVDAETARRRRWPITARQVVTPAVFLLSAVVAYLKVTLGPLTLILIAPAMWAMDRLVPDVRPQGKPGVSGWTAALWQAGTSLVWALVLGFAVWTMTL